MDALFFPPLTASLTHTHTHPQRHAPAHSQDRDLSGLAAAWLRPAGRRPPYQRPLLLAAAGADVLVAAEAADGVQVAAGVLGRSRRCARGYGSRRRGRGAGRRGGERGARREEDQKLVREGFWEDIFCLGDGTIVQMSAHVTKRLTAIQKHFHGDGTKHVELHEHLWWLVIKTHTIHGTQWMVCVRSSTLWTENLGISSLSATGDKFRSASARPDLFESGHPWRGGGVGGRRGGLRKKKPARCGYKYGSR